MFSCWAVQVERQLRTSGLMDAVKVRNQGYDQRTTLSAFIRQYRVVLPGDKDTAALHEQVNFFLSFFWFICLLKVPTENCSCV